MTTRILSGLRLGRIFSIALVGTSLLFAGCDIDEILEVKDPDTVNPGTLNDPALMEVIWAGAISEFTIAYAGAGGDAYLSTSALLSDELFASGSFTTRIATDRRDQFTIANGNTSDGAYVNFHQARYALKDAAKKVAEWESTSHEYYKEMKALEAYVYVALAEGFCSPIPFSELLEDGSFEYGVPMTLDAIFAEAVSIFDGSGAGNLAAVGKGRALVNAGNYAAAAAAVASVPTSYVYHIAHTENGQTNAIYSLQGNGRYSMSDTEGGDLRGLPFRSANDPRVAWYRDPDQPGGFDANYPLYKSRRHYAFTAPLPLATGVEARLIEAEAALAAGGGNWLGILNDLRANVGPLMMGMFPGYPVAVTPLAPLTDPGTPAARRDLLFRERAFWLYGTGHRLGDLRRLVRDYGLNQAVVYPSGAYVQGGSHGTDVVLPLDFDESNNPNWSVDMCDVKSAG